MFRYYATIVLAILLMINVLAILFAKNFIRKKPEENKYDKQERVSKLNRILYLSFLCLAVLFLLINVIF